MLAIFEKRLQLYRCFINDVLGICLVDPDPAEDSRQWTSFVDLMQDYYGLEWIFEKRSKKVNYMDMTISIHEGRIVTSFFENAMNLHLYIPPHSGTPPAGDSLRWGPSDDMVGGIIHNLECLYPGLIQIFPWSRV